MTFEEALAKGALRQVRSGTYMDGLPVNQDLAFAVINLRE